MNKQNNNQERLKKLVSNEKSGWLEKAKWRKENEKWLDISFKIAVKVLLALKANKSAERYPKNQKELAEALNCSPQYVSKLLQGEEKLGIDTITKVGEILDIILIEVPQDKINIDELISNNYKQTFSIIQKEATVEVMNVRAVSSLNDRISFAYDEFNRKESYSPRKNKQLKVFA